MVGTTAGRRRSAAHTRRRSRPSLPCLHPQVLASPTTRDFANVMQFLLRQFDPALPKAFKLEEEVSWGGDVEREWRERATSCAWLLAGCVVAAAC